MSDRPNRIERQAYKWLSKMLDDPGRHATALEHWLSKDSEHRAVYKRVSVEVGRASDSAARIPSLGTAAPTEREGFGWGSRSRMVVVGSVVLVSAGAIGILGAPHAFWHNLVPWEQRATAAHSYEAASSDTSVKLEDGSSVTLFAGAKIATHFTESEREVDLLRGRARFAVSHNPVRPFVVYAEGGKVTATGTLFEVAIARGVSVRLLSGSVVVSLPHAAKERPAKTVRLIPGQQVSYQVPPQATRQPTAAPLATATPRAIETFDDVPAEKIAERVNQSSALKIVFADAAQGKREILADLDISDAEHVAQKLATLLGLVIDRSQPGRLLLKSRD